MSAAPTIQTLILEVVDALIEGAFAADPDAPDVSPLLDCFHLSTPLSLETCCLACHEEALIRGSGLRFWVELTNGEQAKVCCLCYRALKQQGLVERDLYPQAGEKGRYVDD